MLHHCRDTSVEQRNHMNLGLKVVGIHPISQTLQSKLEISIEFRKRRSVDLHNCNGHLETVREQ